MFHVTPELLDFRNLVRKYLAGKAAPDPLLPAADAATIRAWWQDAESELGLGSSFIAEEHGGLGLDFGYAAVLLEEAGRTLLDAPLLPVVVATQALAEVRPDRETAAGLVVPGRITGAVLGAPEWSAQPTLRVEGSPERHTVSGDLGLVLYGRTLDTLLLPAADSGQLGLYAVDTGSEGVHASALVGVDLRREAAHVQLNDAPAVFVAGLSGPLACRIGEVAAIALALEQVGAAQAAMEMAVEYARTRVQFGRPIGSFQAIKHRCAEMLVDVERARSAAYHGVAQVLADADLGEAAALAQVTASEALDRVAYENVQVHGGVGFTWEHPAHLYARRATSTRALLGSPATHRDRLITALQNA